MTRPALTLLTALALLLQAVVGLSPARAVADPRRVAFCHIALETGSDPLGQPLTAHDCLACPICAASAVTPPLIPRPVELPRSSRVTIVVPSPPASPAPSQARTPANLPTGPPRPI